MNQLKAESKRKKTIKGVVVSDKMKGSVLVKVTRLFSHPLYKKRVRRDKKYICNNQVQAKVGDKVVIKSTRPLSKRKHFEVIKIIKK